MLCVGALTLGHDDVCKLIEVQRLQTIPDVMQSLHWKSSEGCAKCRPCTELLPSLNVARHIRRTTNSPALSTNAFTQTSRKTGTYSVVPRMWGGVTSADELRAIADVVEKFEIPTVKLTGGQRIDMLGGEEGGPTGCLGGSW